MNIGDKVRLLHSKEEGIITRFLKGDVVEVEIEEGFKLPIARRELSLVSKNEDKFFSTQNTAGNHAQKQVIEPRKETIKAEKGIFLAFVLTKTPTGESMALHVINNTDWDLPFSITTKYNDKNRGLMGGYLKGKSTQQSPIDLPMKDFDEWGNFTFSAFYFTFGFFIEKQPFVKQMRFRANTFLQHKKIAPIIEKEAYVFQIDAEEKPLEINVNELKAKMFESNIEPVIPKQFSKPSSEIDLHIEKLSKDFMGMNNAQMLDLQIKTFENHLEKTIASGMDEVVFIHGIGNGILKNEIHRRLSKHKNVAYYEDARKEKFGYGATKAKIK